MESLHLVDYFDEKTEPILFQKSNSISISVGGHERS